MYWVAAHRDSNKRGNKRTQEVDKVQLHLISNSFSKGLLMEFIIHAFPSSDDIAFSCVSRWAFLPQPSTLPTGTNVTGR